MFCLTRMRSSRMRTAHTLPYGVSLTETPTPGQRPPAGQRSPPGQRFPLPALCTVWQTGVKTLPCHNSVAAGKNAHYLLSKPWPILNGFTCNLHKRHYFYDAIEEKGSNHMFLTKTAHYPLNNKDIPRILLMGHQRIICMNSRKNRPGHPLISNVDDRPMSDLAQ